MLNTKPRQSLPTQYLTRIAILAALASILFMLEIMIIPPFYKLDFSNLPALLGAFSMGPVPGVLIVLVKSLVGLTHSGTGGVGELADFIMSAAFVIPAALIYARAKTRKGAIISMIVATVVMIFVAALTNYFILFPLLTHKYPEFKFILTATMPFNLLKGVALCVVTGLIYKPLSPLLHVKK